jgi:hypothetical protein
MKFLAPLVLLALLAFASFVHAQRAALSYRGCADLPENVVRGLSGITRVGDTDVYWGAMDNSDRLIKLQIALGDDGSIRSAKVIGELRLPSKRDYEGIAYVAARDSVFVSDESPGITEFALNDARELRRLDIPAVFKNIFPNQGFESLSLSPDGKTLWTANERALTIDGNSKLAADPILSTTRVRLQRFDVSGPTAKSSGQFLYQTSGVHDWGGQIGLCDLAALRDGRLLALERSGAMNFRQVGSIRTRVFLVDVSGAIDIGGDEYAAGVKDDHLPPASAAKTPLFDGSVCDERGQNLEGICLGPSLGGGGRFAVLGVVDNTDGVLHISRSRVVSFELELSAPATAPTTRPATGKAP